MNRRHFFRRLGAAAATAASAPALFLPKLIKPSWKAPKPEYSPVLFTPGDWMLIQYAVVQDPETGLWLESTQWSGHGKDISRVQLYAGGVDYHPEFNHP